MRAKVKSRSWWTREGAEKKNCREIAGGLLVSWFLGLLIRCFGEEGEGEVVLFSLYTSLKMTAKSKIFAKDLVKKVTFMLAPLE